MPESEEELLRLFLAERDAPCPSCRYNLRGLVAARCPECGQPLSLAVIPPVKWSRSFIVGLIGLAAGFGFSFFLFLYAIARWIGDGRARWLTPFMLVTIAGAAVEGAAIVVWLSWQRKSAVRPNGEPRWRAVGCWVLSLLNAVVFTLAIS